MVDASLKPRSFMDDILHTEEREIERELGEVLCVGRRDTHLHLRSERRRVRPDMLPGLSSSTTLKVAILPSAARPLSRHLPRMAVSMFPPHNITTTL